MQAIEILRVQLGFDRITPEHVSAFLAREGWKPDENGYQHVGGGHIGSHWFKGEDMGLFMIAQAYQIPVTEVVALVLPLWMPGPVPFAEHFAHLKRGGYWLARWSRAPKGNDVAPFVGCVFIVRMHHRHGALCWELPGNLGTVSVGAEGWDFWPCTRDGDRVALRS